MFRPRSKCSGLIRTLTPSLPSGRRRPGLGCLGLAIALPALSALCGEGRVTTRQGHSVSGQIRLQSNAVLVANVGRSQLIEVALTNLRSLQLLSGPVGSVPSGARADTLAQVPSWQRADVGPVRFPGASTVQAGRIHLQAGTLQPGDGGESLHFAFRILRGNGEVAGRLLRLKGTAPAARAGLMIRASLDPDAPFVFIGQSLTGGVIEWRGAEAAARPVRHRRQVHDRMRLKREGDLCLVHTSPDGRRWELVETLAVPMGRDILAGCALAGETTPQAEELVCWFDEVRSGQGLRLHGFVPKVTLESGSLLVEDVAYTRDGALHFKGTLPLPDIPLRHAARLDFQWVPPGWESRLQAGKRGALLASGEFFEGDFKSLHEGTCTLSTVLFGLRRFDAHHEVAAIVLGEPRSVPGRGEVRTWSGSILRGRVVSLTEEGLVLVEPLLGRVFVPFFALKEISMEPS